MSRTVLVVHPGAELYGSDRVLLDGVVGFVDAGYRVVVILPGGGPLAAALTDAGAQVRIAPSFVLRKRLLRPSAWVRSIGSAWIAGVVGWRILRRERPAALYVSTITLPLWTLLGRLTRTPTLLHVHEGEASASRVVKALLYAPALAADRIVINSGFSRDVMTSAYPRLSARTEVVANAVPGPRDPMPPRASLDGELRVLYVGRLSPRKGPDVLVRAVALLAERGVRTRVQIVGSAFEGYEWFEEELRRRAETDLTPGQVRFEGFQPEIWPYLDGADVLVVPSRLDEPFGNTAVEGVLAARPVVASRTSGLQEATADVATAVLVEPDDATALANGLAAVIEDWPALVADAETSRAQMSDRHSAATYRTRLTAILEQLVRMR